MSTTYKPRHRKHAAEPEKIKPYRGRHIAAPVCTCDSFARLVGHRSMCPLLLWSVAEAFDTWSQAGRKGAKK